MWDEEMNSPETKQETKITKLLSFDLLTFLNKVKIEMGPKTDDIKKNAKPGA